MPFPASDLLSLQQMLRHTHRKKDRNSETYIHREIEGGEKKQSQRETCTQRWRGGHKGKEKDSEGLPGPGPWYW